jgi:hypothetical protein
MTRATFLVTTTLAFAGALGSGAWPAAAATLTVDTLVDDAALVACDAAAPNDCRRDTGPGGGAGRGAQTPAPGAVSTSAIR